MRSRAYIVGFSICVVAVASGCAGSRSKHNRGDRLVRQLEVNFAPTEEMIATGQGLFSDGSCVKCHKAGGKGGKRAPSLTDKRWEISDGSLEGIKRTIALGVPKEIIGDEYPFAMYPMGKMSLNHKELNALASYVWSLSHK
jgi:mono/diheme cytochrome c family protein